MLPGGRGPVPQLRQGCELALCGLVAAGHPPKEAGEGLGEVSGAGVGLAIGEPSPVHVGASHVDHEHSGPERLPPGKILAGGDDRAPRRLGGPQGSVGAHAQAPGAVALGSEQPVGVAVGPVDVARPGGRCEVVDHEHRIGGGEGEGLQGIRRRRPGPGQVAAVEAGAEMALDEGCQLALARPRGAGQVQGEVAGAEHGPVDRRQQGHGDRLRRHLQDRQAK